MVLINMAERGETGAEYGSIHYGRATNDENTPGSRNFLKYLYTETEIRTRASHLYVVIMNVAGARVVQLRRLWWVSILPKHARTMDA